MEVYVKMKSEILPKRIVLQSSAVSVKELRILVRAAFKLPSERDTFLRIEDAASHHEYVGDSELIPQDTSLVVTRTRRPQAWNPNELGHNTW
eukprot:CAMPEP_0113895880 /NCGR_PEP_ID=MMETSP0780_2-20120614/17650_1 /TAXON_ID=652834 /ORGANISM="Palpitomonas bilix" /LENGTH=91 /DNA_ID=CAMNT_0000886843 /DNA_START=322 /DNA_END=594 /DNA_ORIENTATION=- /assembly_acc=CAM_ASM_000599